MGEWRRHRRNPSRGARASRSRAGRGRSRDQDPAQLPAGDRERGMGRPARGRLRSRLHTDLRRPSWVSTASDLPRTTAGRRRRRAARPGRIAAGRLDRARRPRGRLGRPGGLTWLPSPPSLGRGLVLVALPRGGDGEASGSSASRTPTDARAEEHAQAAGSQAQLRAGVSMRWRRPRKSGSACSTRRAGRWSTARSSKRVPKRAPSAPVASPVPSATGRSTMLIDGREADIPARPARSATRSTPRAS